jgi:hypothetical protein
MLTTDANSRGKKKKTNKQTNIDAVTLASEM